MTTIKYRPQEGPNKDNDHSVHDEGGRFNAAAFDERIYDPIAGLTRRPDTAPKKLSRPKLPSVDGFDRNEASSAESIARKFAPPIRSRDPSHDRRNDSGRRMEHHGGREPDARTSPRSLAGPAGGGRGVLWGFWGFCTSILIVAGTSFVFGFVQPLNGLQPERTDEFPNHISAAPGAGPVAPAGRLEAADSAPVRADEPASDDAVSGAAQPIRSRLPAARIDYLLARGEALLNSGDITSARLLFLRVAAAGDRRGAIGVGMTYDPHVYARLPVAGPTADREEAENWYRKAGEDPTFIPDGSALAVMSSARADTAEIQGQTSEAQWPGSAEWNAACARKYESFDPSTGLYTGDGGARWPCQLP